MLAIVLVLVLKEQTETKSYLLSVVFKYIRTLSVIHEVKAEDSFKSLKEVLFSGVWVDSV